MKITNRWSGDTHGAEVEKTELFCPECGTQDVYVESGEGDYYQGPKYYCRACKGSFHLPSSGANSSMTFSE